MKLSGLLVAGPVAGSRATASALVRLSAGTVFVLFGIGKFTNHSSEVDS